MVNKILNISLVTKIIKKLDLYAYSFQKWVFIKDILTRLNLCIWWIYDNLGKVENVVIIKV